MWYHPPHLQYCTSEKYYPLQFETLLKNSSFDLLT